MAGDSFRSDALEQFKAHAPSLECNIYGRYQTPHFVFWRILRCDGGSNLCHLRIPSRLDPLRCLLLVAPAQWMLLDAVATLLPMLSPAWRQGTVSP